VQIPNRSDRRYAVDLWSFERWEMAHLSPVIRGGTGPYWVALPSEGWYAVRRWMWNGSWSVEQNWTWLYAKSNAPVDLQVSTIALNPAHPRLGEWTTVKVRVKCLDGESSKSVVKLYDNPVAKAYFDDLASRKTKLLHTINGGPMRRGQAWNFNFRVRFGDSMYHLHATAEGSGEDPNPANNVAGKRFRPRGGKDVVLAVCHVIYRNVANFGGQPGVYMSDYQIEQAKEQVRKLAEYVWEQTLCLRLQVQTVVINRMLTESDFQKDPAWFWGYKMGIQPAEHDLIWNHGIDMTGFYVGKTMHSMYLVQNPFAPPENRPDSAPLRLYGMGWWEKAWQGGYLFQWTYLPNGNIRNGNMVHGLLVHEMLHGVEINMKRDGLHPGFPLTHADLEDKRFQRITGVHYETWTFETTPTAWWRDLSVRIRLIDHQSDRF